MKKDTFRDYVMDQLHGLPGVHARPMFGGYGLYSGDHFFGILYEDRLYFKTNESTQKDYIDAGMGRFRPNDQQEMKKYYEVPLDVLEDPEELVLWARKALESQ